MSKPPSNTQSKIPFNRPPLKGRESQYLLEALEHRHFAGDGPFTKKSHAWLEQNLNTPRALLTHSCTAALEMSVILSNVAPGDEVIMPSFTFVSTANAVVLRGGIPVFVDIRLDTLNIDETKIEAAITPKTKAIMVVHYAGVAAEMDPILAIAEKHKLIVIEDAAQGMLAEYRGKALGTIGNLGALSFHETKNVVSGEGGALLVNDTQFETRSEIIREKGTNRSLFFRGQVDKYTWVDVGSSYLPSELLAAVLFAQLEFAQEITNERLAIWQRYHDAFADIEKNGRARRPIIPAHCKHNGHIYYLLAANLEERTEMIAHLKNEGIASTFHYIPLHDAPAGKKYGRTVGDLSTTTDVSERLFRLPVWVGMTNDDVDRVVNAVKAYFGART